MVKVSVIVPVYNVEKYLPDCLDSVLGQSLQEIEVICIDDASPDGSGAILDAYQEKDPRVRVLHLTENHMQGYGRNRGMEMAEGKYVYFLDSDDMITKTALEELFELAEREALDGVFFDSQAVFESEELRKYASSYICVRKGEYPAEPLPGKDLLDLFVEKNEWMVYVQREFWRRDYLLENGIFYPEKTEHEDELFSFEAILLAKRTRYVRKEYFIHRYRENSVMTRVPHPKDFHGYFTIYYKMAEFAKKHDLHTTGVEQCLMHMYDCMLNFVGDFEKNARPEDWFTHEEYERYIFFQALRRSKQLSDERTKTVWKPLEAYRELWIYGAGRVARSVFARLMDTQHSVTRFLVTQQEGNPAYLFGLPVVPVKEVEEQPKDCAVVVAMAKQTHAGPAAILDEKGFTYFLYAANVLEGPFRRGSES